MKRIDVLIIDDDRIYALGLKTWLRALGLGSRVRAIDAVPYDEQQALPDVVLVDPQMAGLKCTFMVSEVRRRFPGSRIVVCSSTQWFQSELAENAVSHGADGLYCKGQPDEDLLSTIMNLVEQASCSQSSNDARITAKAG